jgi:spoIIIJ-associated protein
VSAEAGAAASVRELLERIAGAMGLEARVEVRVEGDTVVGEYRGEDVAELIGRRGQTIDAIQHLAYRIASRAAGARQRVLVDAGGYRERRAASLRATAEEAAVVALREGRAVKLEPMSALERKVVHEHLKSRRDVETYSEGEEPARRLVVAPLID